MKKAKTVALTVRMPADLVRAIEETARKSGWSVSEQVRFELMHNRGMWREPYFPSRPDMNSVNQNEENEGQGSIG